MNTALKPSNRGRLSTGITIFLIFLTSVSGNIAVTVLCVSNNGHISIEFTSMAVCCACDKTIDGSCCPSTANPVCSMAKNTSSEGCSDVPLSMFSLHHSTNLSRFQDVITFAPVYTAFQVHLLESGANEGTNPLRELPVLPHPLITHLQTTVLLI